MSDLIGSIHCFEYTLKFQGRDFCPAIGLVFDIFIVKFCTGIRVLVIFDKNG